MSNKSALVQIFILIFTVGIFTQCAAQDKKNETKGIYTVTNVVRPADEAKIEGNIPDYEIKERNLEYLQALALPEIKFVFESKSIGNGDFSEDLKAVLNAHWKEAVKFFYDSHFNKPANAQAYYDKSVAWSKYCFKTEQELEKLSVEAPNGKRNISQTEAGEIVGFLNNTAVAVKNKVKSIEE